MKSDSGTGGRKRSLLSLSLSELRSARRVHRQELDFVHFVAFFHLFWLSYFILIFAQLLNRHNGDSAVGNVLRGLFYVSLSQQCAG